MFIKINNEKDFRKYMYYIFKLMSCSPVLFVADAECWFIPDQRHRDLR